jgi:hypothetical protein
VNQLFLWAIFNSYGRNYQTGKRLHIYFSIFMKARYTLSLVAFMCHPENGDQEIAKSLATPKYPQQLGV